MDEIAVSTVVYVPAEEVYEFLVDFPGYANYSEHLTDVEQRGDGSAGTRYLLRFAWWKLTYTAHSKVTNLDPPNRIDWRSVKDIDAVGQWRVEPLAEPPADAPADAETACRVHFEVAFNPDTAREGALDLPRFVSFEWVLGKVKPKVTREAERIVERVVADLEGSRRDVELTVRERPDTL